MQRASLGETFVLRQRECDGATLRIRATGFHGRDIQNKREEAIGFDSERFLMVFFCLFFFLFVFALHTVLHESPHPSE